MLAAVENKPVSVEAKPVLRVEGLKAYYQMNYFGVRREVRAVDDVSLTINRNEIYGIAGESSSGKSSLIKTIAGAITPPLRVVEGSVKFDFGGKELDVYAQRPAMKAARWKHLSYVMQGSMNVLNPVRKVKHAFVTSPSSIWGFPKASFGRGWRVICSASGSIQGCWNPIRTSFRAVCGSV